MGWLRSVRRVIGWAAVGLGALHLTSTHVCDFVLAENISMEPTICDGDLLFVNKIRINTVPIKRGDVIIARSPRNPRTLVCKRVTKVEFDYMENPPPEFPRSSVPRGYMWLESDNKLEEDMVDSRDYGPVPRLLTQGRVTYRLWPPSRFGSLRPKIHNDME